MHEVAVLPIGVRNSEAVARAADCARSVTLGAEVLRVIEVAAVFGEPFSVEDLAEAAGVGIGQVLAPLQDAVAAGVLQACEGLLMFGDPARRARVYRGTLGAVRSALHRRIGMIRLRCPGAGASAAEHLLAAARAGDRALLTALDEAGNELIRSDPPAAARVRVQALRLTGSNEEPRPSRAAAAVEALLSAGRVDQACRLAEDALRSGGAGSASGARLRIAFSAALLAAGRPEQAVAQAETVLGDGPAAPGVTEAATTARLHALLHLPDRGAAQSAAESVLAGLHGAGSDATLAVAILALARLAWVDGRPAAAVGMARAAVRRADLSAADSRLAISARMTLATMLGALSEPQQAMDMVEALEGHLCRRPDTSGSPAPLLLRARLALWAGQFAAACDLGRSALQTAEDLGTRVFVPEVSAWVAVAQLRLGAPVEAAELLTRARGGQGPGAPTGLGWASTALAEARLAAARSDPGPALGLLATPGSATTVAAAVLLEDADVAPWLTGLAMSCGDRALAAEIVGAAERLAAAGASFGCLRAPAVHARGLLLDDPGLLQQALVEHAQPWARACAAEDFGAALARRRDPAAAGALREALTGFQRLGAVAEVDRVRSRLRSLGVRTRHWTRVPRAARGWESLTETEMRVARIVAEGATNAQAAQRLFLSRHTVDFHLRQIFRKLRIHSRVELTRLVLAGSGPAEQS